MSIIFFDDVLPLRLPAAGSTTLLALDEKSGFVGDFKLKDFKPMSGALQVPTAWLPTDRVARAWQALVSDRPFAP
jgi:hypothetical protein